MESRSAPALTLAILALASGPLLAEAPGRHYDARIAFNEGFKALPKPAQEGALQALSGGESAGLSVRWDENTGALRTLSNPVGYLTGPAVASLEGTEGALPLALDFVSANRGLLGLEEADLAGYEVTDNVFSAPTGATHLYLRQVLQGIPVYNGQLHVNVNREGRILSVNNQFMPGAARAANASQPALGLDVAAARAASHLGIAADVPAVLEGPKGVRQLTRVAPKGLSRRPIQGGLMYLPIRAGMLRLVWNFQIETLDKQHWYDFTVDAASGKVWTRIDWVASDSYRAYALPAESPIHASPVPPGDGRTLVSDPADSTASPFGWHDTNGAAGAEFATTQGNNAHAYTDADDNDINDPGSSPDGGAGRVFDFSLDLTQAASAYRPAAVSQLFYVNNMIHDIQYQYGFDEAGGNFQENNYGRGGAGSDYVYAEAQDGGGLDDANFATPADGGNPRMQMYLWDPATPMRDGDLDTGIVIHEYGHGISNRLVGGPANVSCLGNSQQPGEGLSDWWALVYTVEPGDAGTDGRGFGTYLLAEPTSGPGIRAQKYSTSPGINTWTYASISGLAVPHGVGSVWAQAAWEVYWSLVDFWGYDADLYNAAGSAGNQRAMLYVNEGLKNTACSPTFTDVRDGIIQAAVDNHGGEDVCRLWQTFAAFGLGMNAVSGGSNSITPTNGFLYPAGICGPAAVVNDKSVTEGNTGSKIPTFQVTLTEAVASTVTVDYATANGSATAADYVSTSGTLTFNPGVTTRNVGVSVLGDTLDEGSNEYLFLNLSNPTGVLVDDNQGRLTIKDDDPAPTVSISNKTVAEGNSGLRYITFTATLSAASSRTVKADFATSDGTAIEAGVPSTNHGGSVTITDDSTASPYPATITVPSLGANASKVVVKLNGLSHGYPADMDILLLGPTGANVILLSDTGGGTPLSGVNLVFDDAAASGVASPIVSGTYKPTNTLNPGGGDSWPAPGPGAATNVLLSAFNGLNPAGVWKLLVMDTAALDAGTLATWDLLIYLPNGDYVSKTGTVTFVPGTTLKTFSAQIRGDVAVEADETFNMNLTSPVNAVLGDATGVGTIRNDD